MGAKGITSILAGYFNQGEGKRSLTEFQTELKALTAEEKRELAEGVCAITGDTIKDWGVCAITGDTIKD